MEENQVSKRLCHILTYPCLDPEHMRSVASPMPTAQQQQQEKQLQQNRTPRWIQLLIGGPVVVSVLMFISLWSMLPSHQSLRGIISAPTLLETHLSDLYTLVQQRRSKTVASDGELLHLDDLARSDSYEQWVPLIMSKCMHGMDKLAAPCIKEAQTTNLVEAQELLYPAFRLRLPHFSSTVMQDKWLSQGLHLERMRVSEDKEWAYYPAFQGQNMVFKNAVFRGDPPPDVWSDESCMGSAASHTSFVHDVNENSTGNELSIDTLIVATSPDSWSFQHFIDRVAVVWSQAQLAVPTKKKVDTVIVSGKSPRDAIVNEVYELMVGHHLHNITVSARHLVFSCRAPLIHPYTTQRITENILQALPAPKTDAQTDRNLILFLSRTKGGEAHNGGRKLLNEDKLFDAVSAMLKKEGRPEKLEYFRHSDFAGLTEVASFMRDRVKMMIGPHGAAFYNARFAQPRTALIEIIPDPDKFFVPCFWEQARLLGQDYSAHVGRVVSSKNDMQLTDVEEVARLVRNRLTFLDKPYRPSDALDHTYSWSMETKITLLSGGNTQTDRLERN
ncbi:hypothetical protein JM18_007270 [Phytophthora kernoviae]|uniref:Glycosyltransferase 61 catalytic domain-containing protein n=2 Tax=Phytophthora kernoviae TaxID=325452 RepID=A0A921SD59_9STRA|nr:hypothetical protein G195_008769 [Phytophthora kernoviae 00238/432]KAG2520113.1 hypothetical protein JM18_007270 [Phytophthora kernoviae]